MFVVYCVGRCFSDGLIARSLGVLPCVCVCQIVCGLETSAMRWSGPELGFCATGKRSLKMKNLECLLGDNSSFRFKFRIAI
jgi:hypothetical protein